MKISESADYLSRISRGDHEQVNQIQDQGGENISLGLELIGKTQNDKRMIYFCFPFNHEKALKTQKKHKKGGKVCLIVGNNKAVLSDLIVKSHGLCFKNSNAFYLFFEYYYYLIKN